MRSFSRVGFLFSSSPFFVFCFIIVCSRYSYSVTDHIQSRVTDINFGPVCNIFCSIAFP